MRNRVLLSGVLMLASLSATAADNGFYLGGSIGQSNAEFESGFNKVDGDDTGFKVIAGLRPLDWLGAEVSYVDFGKIEDNGQTVEADGISAFAVGFLAVGPVDLFAKAGLINQDATVRGSFSNQLRDGSSTDFAYGAGVQFRLLSLSFRAEYEKFDVDNLEKLDMASIGVTYTFL